MSICFYIGCIILLAITFKSAMVVFWSMNDRVCSKKIECVFGVICIEAVLMFMLIGFDLIRMAI